MGKSEEIMVGNRGKGWKDGGKMGKGIRVGKSEVIMVGNRGKGKG
jgi:hypothetical protein